MYSGVICQSDCFFETFPVCFSYIWFGVLVALGRNGLIAPKGSLLVATVSKTH